MTSHDVVARIRRLAKTRRVGHGGTLDPMATGVLIIGVNRATRLLTYVIGSSKSYAATIRLGQSTITDDAEGDVTAVASVAGVTEEAIHAGLAAQRGEIDQVPSAVSAIKVDGKRAYKRVREGEAVALPPRRVTIARLDVLDIRRAVAGAVDVAGSVDVAGPVGGAGAVDVAGSVDVAGPVDVTGSVGVARAVDVVDVDIEVDCSSGTYIRAIARDLGAALGVGGHLTVLRRTAVGRMTLAEALTLDELEARAPEVVGLSMADAARQTFPQRTATPDEARVLSHGGPLEPVGIAGPYAVFDPAGDVLAIVSEREGRARAEIVLAPA
ncbi:tRNA pseudouridine(55) synthase TruB [Actinoplanes sp. CA-142083]|uniref:tRNA pseudouridine(55) synthase TruB n=1 Tax=Actinoplanes sp. CA-142083 TaxID=3239903 RepID=UPI003D92E92A